MKTRIIILITAIISSLTCTLRAQEYKIAVENSKDCVLSLVRFTGDITIEGYAGSDVVFTSANADYKVPERATGLKPVYPGGIDNTGFGLSVEKDGNQIEVTCLLPFTKRGDYTIKVPENMPIKVQSQCEYRSDIFVKKMKNEIEIQTCHGINLKDVSGPLVLSTISGNIDITFADFHTDKPCSINSIRGEIDVTLPSKTAADIEIQTVAGNVYSDFDFTDNSKDMKRIGGNQLSYKLNGGGNRFSIVTVSSNIYIRKGL